MFRNILLLALLVTLIMAEYPTGADYLIICPDAYQSRFTEFAQWKTRKGYVTRIANLSETGTSTTAIRSYIQNAYNTWEPAPRFVLIGSSINNIPMIYGGTTEYGDFLSDWAYGNMDSDIYNEVLVGRLPARNVSQLETMIDKIMHYEIETEEGDWLSRGMTIVYEDYETHDDSIYWANTDTAALGMENNDFLNIYRLSYADGHDHEDVSDAVDGPGCSFILFRGSTINNWSPPFNIDPETLANGYRNPVVCSITCHTIADNGSPEAGSWWMRSDYADGLPAGAVGYVGTTSSISGGAHLRGEVAEGLAHSYFADTTDDLARAVEAGRLNQYSIYGNTPQYTSIVLLGDPEMNIRTRPPARLTVEHTLALNSDSEDFDAIVTRDGEPVGNALVCLTDFENVHIAGLTDMTGRFHITLPGDLSDSLSLTVTAKNSYPYMAGIPFIVSGPYIVVLSYSIDDREYGNGDGVMNPGERAFIILELANIGLDDITELSVAFASLDDDVSILSPETDIASIEAGSSTAATFEIEVSEDSSDMHVIDFITTIEATVGRSWIYNSPYVQVVKAHLAIDHWTVNDAPPLGNGNRRLDVGEDAVIDLYLTNNSQTEIQSGMFHFSTDDEVAAVESGAITAYDIAPHESKKIPVTLSLSDRSGFFTELAIDIDVEIDDVSYTSTQSLTFTVPISGSDKVFAGPDGYGYYCYDDTDTEIGRAPVYNWFDIADADNLVDAVTDEDDLTATLSSPIDIQHYGESFDRISICSNGFAAFGEQDWSGGSGPGDGHERPIPSTGEANALLAAFWTDLNPRRTGDIYADYVESENVIVITWNDVDHYSPTGILETFQIVIRDPDFYPTPTDDAEILFQYQNVSDDSYNTTGIENIEGTDGIQYCYRGSYDPTSQPLVTRRAILFTTNPPAMDDFIWLYLDDAGISAGDDGYVSPGETITMTPTLANGGNVDAADISMSLSSTHPEISISESILHWDRISSDEVSTSSSSFGIVLGDFPSDTVIMLDFSLTASGSYSRQGVVPLQINGSMSTIEVTVQAGWNLLAYPFTDSAEVSSQIPDVILPAFSYNRETRLYDAEDSFVPGMGLWVLTPEPATCFLSGRNELTENSLLLQPGWNLVGVLSTALDLSVLTDHDAVVEPVYRYDGSRFTETESLLPGIGYWVLSTDNLTVELP